MAAPRDHRFDLRGFLLSGQGWPYFLTPFIPIAIVLDLLSVAAPVVFVTSALGVIPTAALMSRATEELAARSGPGIGGLLNVTFGNAPELAIALFALADGLQEVVKASLIGSVLSNSLLVLGASMFVGGLRRERQRFNRTAATVQATLLLLAIAGVVMPAVYALARGHGLPHAGDVLTRYSSSVNTVSAAVAVVLIACYGGWLLFSLRSHRTLFNPPDDAADEVGHEPWSVRRSVVVLAIAGVLVAIMSEILTGSISETAKSVGLTEFFIGVIAVAIVGNAAEHYVAVVVAHKDKMDLAVNIAVGSSGQIALFVLPVLVLVSFVLGPSPMALVLNAFELVGVILAVVIANYVTQEGESTWFEGVQLLGVYVIMALVFFFA